MARYRHVSGPVKWQLEGPKWQLVGPKWQLEALRVAIT